MSDLYGTSYFQSVRDAYQPYGNVYALGTFLNTNPRAMEADEFQLVPTKSTVTMFDLLRQKIGAPTFEDEFQTNSAKYRSRNKWIKAYLENQFHKNMAIGAEGTEFLDGIGNQAVEHTLRLVKVVDQEYNVSYFLLTGLAVLESTVDELINAKKMAQTDDPFIMQDNKLALNGQGIVAFIRALAADYFADHIQDDELQQLYQYQNVGGNFMTQGMIKEAPDAKETGRIGYLLTTTHQWQA
ncbi:hypothetical protein IV38_GL002121 [Lactobacillus selangorensis]|uniref:Uncharacterized protein n=1 Tax=Lactobacillus selangorensis TaxID=81857 RepID=A0A0R2FR20_9LACO|nr:hypothetical protein [Lactobacillus selangorensis]KRN27468.1 hypothetical protein IV38_GL002121 [Lactobacillus selangorensis]KRN31335.1 hypothetical protein IV40_GL001329 [Lactobacillus selangorensis]